MFKSNTCDGTELRDGEPIETIEEITTTDGKKTIPAGTFFSGWHQGYSPNQIEVTYDNGSVMIPSEKTR